MRGSGHIAETFEAGAERGDLRAVARTPLGSLTDAPGADLEGLILDRLVGQVGWTVRLHMVVGGSRRR